MNTQERHRWWTLLLLRNRADDEDLPEEQDESISEYLADLWLQMTDEEQVAEDAWLARYREVVGGSYRAVLRELLEAQIDAQTVPRGVFRPTDEEVAADDRLEAATARAWALLGPDAQEAAEARVAALYSCSDCGDSCARAERWCENCADRRAEEQTEEDAG